MKKLLVLIVCCFATQALAQNSSITALCKNPTGNNIPMACSASGKPIVEVSATGMPGVYSEDSLTVDGEPGVAILTRRVEAISSSATTDDNHAWMNSDYNGRVYVQASSQTSTLSQGGTDRTIKFVAIVVAGADSDQIIAAVSGRKIKVLGYVIVCDGATTITFEDGDGTDVTGAMALAANGGISAAVNHLGYFVTPVANKSLKILKGSAVNCGGHLTYVEVS